MLGAAPGIVRLDRALARAALLGEIGDRGFGANFRLFGRLLGGRHIAATTRPRLRSPLWSLSSLRPARRGAPRPRLGASSSLSLATTVDRSPSCHSIFSPVSRSIASRYFVSDAGDDGEGFARASGAAGAADAVDVVLGMDRHVEIEDVADVGNVEAARGDVGCDEQLQLAGAKALQHRHARALVHVAMQRAGVELVFLTSDL